MISRCRWPLVAGKSLLLTNLLILALVSRPGQAIEMMADYRYAVQPTESIEMGRQKAFAEALRLAVEISPLFREATADVVDSPLLKKLVEAVLSQALCSVEVVEQDVKGRTVYVKVRLFFNEEKFKRLVEEELHHNRALRILDVRVEDNEAIRVTFQALQQLDWLTTAYAGGMRDQGDLVVTFYDAQGVLLQMDRFSARKAVADEVLVPGQIAVHRFAIPSGASSYHVEVASGR